MNQKEFQEIVDKCQFRFGGGKYSPEEAAIVHAAREINTLHHMIYNILCYRYEDLIDFRHDDSSNFFCALEQLQDYMHEVEAEKEKSRS